jgi:hypothetical protein
MSIIPSPSRPIALMICSMIPTMATAVSQQIQRPICLARNPR